MAIAATAAIENRKLRNIATLNEVAAIAESKAKTFRTAWNLRLRQEQVDSQLAKLKSADKSVSSIWIVLTTVLPDTVWLQQMSIKDEIVVIEGTADNAESLIALVENDPLFQQVEFAAPVLQIPGTQRQHFSMRMKTGDEK